MSAAPKALGIVVVGSVNMDLMLQCPHLPVAGETVLGHGFQQAPGGKGANQAVASARLGAGVSLIGCVGDDAFGEAARNALKADGVHTDFLQTVPHSPTGVAMVTSDANGENCIALAPGANQHLLPNQLENAEHLIANAGMVLCQLEIPLATVRQAMRLAQSHNTPFVLNPAPAQTLSPQDLAGVDTLILNTVEAAMLAGIAVTTREQAEQAAGLLKAAGVSTVIVTLGGDGALVVDATGSKHYPAPKVKAVDTTGAGDTFVGAYATARVMGHPLSEAIDFAQRAAAYSVTHRGAQASMPHRSALERPSVSLEDAAS
jgi:ribokinase